MPIRRWHLFTFYWDFRAPQLMKDDCGELRIDAGAAAVPQDIGSPCVYPEPNNAPASARNNITTCRFDAPSALTSPISCVRS